MPASQWSCRYKKVKTEITLDAFNLINLFDSKSGQFQYLSFGQSTLIQPVPTTVTTTAPLTGYNIAALTATDASSAGCATTCARAGSCSWARGCASSWQFAVQQFAVSSS